MRARRPPKGIRIGEFFANTLGAPLRNLRWSWGAFIVGGNRLFLRVWEHECKKNRDGMESVLVLDEM